jgi:hypothetical protein
LQPHGKIGVDRVVVVGEGERCPRLQSDRHASENSREPVGEVVKAAGEGGVSGEFIRVAGRGRSKRRVVATHKTA